MSNHVFRVCVGAAFTGINAAFATHWANTGDVDMMLFNGICAALCLAATLHIAFTKE